VSRKIQVGFLALLDFQFLHFVEQSATRFVDTFPPARIVEAALPGALVPLFILFNVGWIAIGVACYALLIRPGTEGGRKAVVVFIVIEAAISLGDFLWAGLAGGRYVPGLVTAFLLLGASVWLAIRLRVPASVPPATPQSTL
jgi:hypothetical protein